MFLRRKPKHQFIRDLKQEILGKCAMIEHPKEGQPAIHFGADFKIVVSSQWRLIDDDRILVTDTDDGHRFGLPAPVDAAAKANQQLAKKRLESIDFDATTGDLRLRFSGSLVLEILTISSGYESWQMYLADEYFAVGASGGLV